MPTLAPRGRSCPNVVDDGVREKDMEWINSEDVVNERNQEFIHCYEQSSI